MSESVPCIQDAEMPEQEMNIEPVQAEANRHRSLSNPPGPDLAVDHPRNHKETTQTMASVHDRFSSRLRPSLQNLPLELLESILIYSKTLALPRSSPLSGAKLSGRATLLQLFRVAFFNTWEILFGMPLKRWCETQSNGTSWLSDDPSLQADIDFILEAHQVWADKYARGRWYRHYENETTARGVIEGMYSKNVRVRDRYIQHALQHEEKTWNYDARACFEADYERALHFPPLPWIFLAGCLMASPDVHPEVHPPVHLLTGPWDEEKKRRLFWLVRAGASVTRGFMKSGWKVRLACLDVTVIYAKEPDSLIINCLIGPWIFRGGFPEDIRHKRLVDVCSRLDRGGDTLDMREVLREAVRAMDSDGQFTEHHFPDAEYRYRERVFGERPVEE
ncbi:hypothetical protein E4U52_001471 [Claviceps spartinae]|nr:hypothetical protein E4U52_001471 [Claviceps spartinae]